MKWIVALCLLASAALWGRALLAPKPRPPELPDALVGDYRIARFEPPPENAGMPNPFPLGQVHRFLFKKEGSYENSIFVVGGFEMTRIEGRVTIEGPDRLKLQAVAENRTPVVRSPDRYRYSFVDAPEGRRLHLLHEELGYQLFLEPGSRDEAR